MSWGKVPTTETNTMLNHNHISLSQQKLPALIHEKHQNTRSDFRKCMLGLARPNASENRVPCLQITSQHRLVLQGSSLSFTQRYFFSYSLHFTEILSKSPGCLLPTNSPSGNQQLMLSACPGMQRSAPQPGPHPAPSGQSRIFSFRGGALTGTAPTELIPRGL